MLSTRHFIFLAISCLLLIEKGFTTRVTCPSPEDVSKLTLQNEGVVFKEIVREFQGARIIARYLLCYYNTGNPTFPASNTVVADLPKFRCYFGQQGNETCNAEDPAGCVATCP